jgi:hypothetical protein
MRYYESRKAEERRLRRNEENEHVRQLNQTPRYGESVDECIERNRMSGVTYGRWTEEEHKRFVESGGMAGVFQRRHRPLFKDDAVITEEEYWAR